MFLHRSPSESGHVIQIFTFSADGRTHRCIEPLLWVDKPPDWMPMNAAFTTIASSSGLMRDVEPSPIEQSTAMIRTVQDSDRVISHDSIFDDQG